MDLLEIEKFFVLIWSLVPKRTAQGTLQLAEEQIEEIEARA